MPYGIYISAAGAQAQSARMEVIANNLANTDTVGFKRDLALFQARQAEEIERGRDQPLSKSVNNVGGGVRLAEVRTDFSAGPMKYTNIPTDMAINGEGFFVVRRGNEDLLTRAGNFSITAAGDLVTSSGYPVLAENGSPVRIDPDLGDWQVSPEGGIEQQGSSIPLAIVKPKSLGDLVHAGENLFAPLAPTQPLEPTQRARLIASGYLEQSSVKATTEMTDMIQTSRAFEANVNMIRNQDQILGELVGRVLRT